MSISIITNGRSVLRHHRSTIIYGISLAFLMFLLKWLELRYIIFDHSLELYIGSIAVIFTALGIWLALRSLCELLRYAVSESDGSASDVLIRLLGGTRKANELVHGLGADGIAIATTEMLQCTYDTVQYQNHATPRALTRLLQICYKGSRLSDSSKGILLRDMTETTTSAKRLKGLLPVGTIVAHKTGTARTDKRGLTRATKDVGIITLPNGKHLAIAVLISDSYNSERDREMTIAKIAKAAFDHWSGQ